MKELNTIAFYNLENLFDTRDDKRVMDDDFTPEGKLRWSPKRYRRKLRKLGKTVARLGEKTTRELPVLLGVAEVENKGVLQDLTATRWLREGGYEVVHFDSPDERGIDTGLLYRKGRFELLQAEPLPLQIYNPDGSTDTTRDILYARGLLQGEELHLFVNHWPSRRAGEAETAFKRQKAAEIIKERLDAINSRNHQPNYILMGDFNDGPQSDSIQWLVNSAGLYNPMLQLKTPARGSANYRKSWSLFDQIIVSHSFLDYEPGTHSFAHANIFDDHFLKEWHGNFKGNPFRTFAGRRYLGGYSDHFPVYIQLKYDR